MNRKRILLMIINLAILIIIGVVIRTNIVTKRNAEYEKSHTVTFAIVDNTVSNYVYNDHFLALTKDGSLYVYDKHGKEMRTNQTDLRFIDTYGDLLFIKNDGSIISNINEDTYEGTIIGKIPGAVSGCKYSDTAVIVTDNGDLYFQDSSDEETFIFEDSEQYEGWTKVNDIKDVVEAVINDEARFGTLLVLNKKGEVYCCSAYDRYGSKKLSKISKDFEFTDISQCSNIFLLLDDQGYLYAYGVDYGGWYHAYDHITRIDCYKNIQKLLISFSQGTVITKDKHVYIWQKEEILEGKSLEYDMHSGELREVEWDEIVPSDSNYLYIIKDGIVSRIPIDKICDKVESW